MAELMTNLAELVTEINRIEPQLEDPLRHAKREIKRQATTILEHAVSQAWMALRAIDAIQDAQNSAAALAAKGE